MATQFSVMTWNLENLFGLGTEFGPDTPDEFNQKIESLARTILELDPDVVAVQEVGGSEPFGALQAALGGRYPHNQLSVHPDTRGILVGFLSKLPFEDSEDILEFPEGALQNVPGIDGRGDPIILTRLGRGALRNSSTAECRSSSASDHSAPEVKTSYFPQTDRQPQF
jgi:hypothetical protein